MVDRNAMSPRLRASLNFTSLQPSTASIQHMAVGGAEWSLQQE